LAPAPALLIARLRGKKALINYRSGEARDHLRRFRSARSILARADCLVVPSGYLVDVFREYDLRAQAVPNVVDLSQFSLRSRDRIRPRMVCTRGFHPYYAVDVVVRAFAQVKQLHPDACLNLVGSGPMESEIRALVMQLNLGNVTFGGIAPREDIGRHYDQADIFINGSYLDNMPVSILEAFASGLPVASTAPEGIQYIIEHERTGLLSAPGDASALAQNVIRLLEEPDLATRIIANAYAQSRNYHWEVLRDQWLEIYRDLTREPNHLEEKLTQRAVTDEPVYSRRTRS
jgi:glycosyltransferase involved in cell wall biosynthesis